MTLAAVGLKTFQSSTDASSYTIPVAFTPPANELLLVWVASTHLTIATTPPIPTLTGNNVTWEVIDDQVFNSIAAARSRGVWFRGVTASPTNTTLLIDFAGASQSSCVASVLAISGSALGGNGAAAIVQSVKMASDSSNTPSVAYAAFASPTNGGVAGLAKGTTSAITHRGGWTETDENGATSLALRYNVQFINNDDVVASASWAPSAATAVCMIALEISEPVAAAGWGHLISHRRNRIVYA